MVEVQDKRSVLLRAVGRRGELAAGEGKRLAERQRSGGVVVVPEVDAWMQAVVSKVV